VNIRRSEPYSAATRNAVNACFRRGVASLGVACGGARSGKTTYCVAQLRTAGVPQNAIACWAVTEGFVGAIALKRNNASVAAARAAPRAAGAAVLVGIHVNVFDCPGSLHGLSQLLHDMLVCGIIYDAQTGVARLLESGVQHHIMVELPALSSLSRKSPGGPRVEWADGPAATHPFLATLAPLGCATLHNVNAVTNPLVIDANAALVAEYLTIMAQSAATPPPAAWPRDAPAVPAEGHAAVRTKIV
jgi:hypothetical protein